MLAQLLSLLVIAAQVQVATPRDGVTAKVGSAAISGRITEQESNRPLPRAIVTLIASAGGRQVEVLADAEGRYEFAGLEPGQYGVLAAPGELQATHLRHAFGQAEPLDQITSPPRSGVALTAGERRADVNIALMRALAIEGRVLDPLDTPMAEVTVMLMRTDGTPYPAYPVSSDDRGDYRLFGLAPGRYRVCAAPERSSDEPAEASRFVHTCHPAAVAPGDAADIVLTTSDASGTDIRVQRGGTFTISGSVTDAAGAVVDRPHVSAFPIDRRTDSGYAMGRAGRFMLRGLLPGRYIVQASVGGPDYPDDTRPPAREREVGYTSIDVGAAEIVDCAITLSKAQTVTGRMVFEGGPAPPPSRLRMAVQAIATGLGWGMVRERPPTAAVSDKLTFELTGLYRLPLTFAVTGLPDGWAVKSIRYDGEDVTNVPVTLGSGSGPGRVEIVATSRVAQPSVRVTDERGEPLSSFLVVLLSTDPARRKGSPASIPGWKAEDGVVSLGALLPGEYYVAALGLSDSGLFISDLARLEDYVSVATRVTFVERDDRTVNLRLTPLPAARR
jgi:Carboxypeptidase regulatory-like domain